MTDLPTFAVGDRVMKHSGDYTGPGIVRQVVELPDGRTRYLVGHHIWGGTGEFLHIYSGKQLWLTAGAAEAVGD